MTKAKNHYRPTFLAPECDLGQRALAYWRAKGAKEPQYMRLTGDGCVAFGWREDLPEHTQTEHFIDKDGRRYDAGENKVPVAALFPRGGRDDG